MKSRHVVLPIIFTHSIVPRPELVDEKCLNEHIHDDAVLTVVVESEWIDFKSIKAIVQNVLKSFPNDGAIMSLGVTDTEGFIDAIGKGVIGGLLEVFDDMSGVKVKVHLKETQKYAISDIYTHD
jgi:hypothetical protein